MHYIYIHLLSDISKIYSTTYVATVTVHMSDVFSYKYNYAYNQLW